MRRWRCYVEELAKIRGTDAGRDVSVVFVSPGDQGVVEVFREILRPLNYTVHDKWTILANLPHELAVVRQADWDAKGIVDHAVLSAAMFFMGASTHPSPLSHSLDLVLIKLWALIDIWASTFSQNIAFTRTAEDEEDFMSSAVIRNATKQPDGRLCL